MTDNAPSGSLKRFSGLGNDPIGDFKVWSRWAQAHCIVQRAKNTSPDALGPMLYCLLDGEALTTLQDFDIEDFAVEGGEQIILQRLSERLPEPEAPDKVCLLYTSPSPRDRG